MNTSIHADYKTGERPMARSFKSRLSCIVAVATCALFASGLFLGVPQFVEIFEDFDAEMSPLTTFIIQIRIPAIAGLTLLAVALVIKEVALRHRRNITRPVNLIVLVIVAITLAVASFGLFLPLMNMFQSVD